VYQELQNHPSIRTRSLGEFQLKNVRLPVEVFALDHEDIVVPRAGDLVSQVAARTSKSIAVIPFECQESSQEDAFFADGLSEEIANGLSKVDGLSIIARATCEAIKNSTEDPLKVSRRYHVTHLLDGSVRSIGNQVKASVRLVNTAEGYQVWSETFRGNLEDIFDLQENIAKNIVRAMRVNFNLQETSEPVLEKQTSSPEAHQLYLKGLHHWNKNNPESIGKASEFFSKALEADAGYSPAQCSMSHCYAFLGSCGMMQPTDAYAKALDFAMKAIETNPRNADAHLAIANIKFYHYWDWEGTKSSLEKAESLGLNSSLLHQSFGLYYAATGEIAKGVGKMEQALGHDPLSIPVMTMLGTLYLFNSDFDRAIKVFDETLELEPSFRSALLYKGVALSCKENLEDALNAFQRYHEMVNHPQKGITGLIIAYHAMGEFERANTYLNRLYERLDAEPTAAVEIDLAIAHAGIGNYDKSIEFLNRVYEMRFSIACMGMIWIIRCPYFKGLWDTEGYKNLLNKMGLPDTTRLQGVGVSG
jgi:TolB-like protein